MMMVKEIEKGMQQRGQEDLFALIDFGKLCGMEVDPQNLSFLNYTVCNCVSEIVRWSDDNLELGVELEKKVGLIGSFLNFGNPSKQLERGTRSWECFRWRGSVPIWKGLTLEEEIVGNPSVSLSPTLDINEKVDYYIKIQHLTGYVDVESESLYNKSGRVKRSGCGRGRIQISFACAYKYWNIPSATSSFFHILSAIFFLLFAFFLNCILQISLIPVYVRFVHVSLPPEAEDDNVDEDDDWVLA
ncbi:hypothetical protein LR48_Vigan09g049100 [Vigna angularis]|uniref:Uncharacterized protein n=1 Tax=Phaseolus angularis TaxID=3914 RepID=A0A0L9VA76_PHAAN|nr:hypothetical protein LR48_Vigan09g049100 [Vigna angularis]